MKAIKNHIILSIIAILATNVYFLMCWLIDTDLVTKNVVTGLRFSEFMLITNGALIIISLFSITYKNLGDTFLAWGYSNVFRFVALIVLSVAVFAVSSSVLFSIHFSINSPQNVMVGLAPTLFSKHFIALNVFFFLVSVFMFFISNLERRSGDVFRLMAQSMGNSIKPKLVDRGFMFIDLNNATTIAETLGSKQYASLLRSCFKFLNELVAVSPFEVYQYVGDEAVLAWKTNTHKMTKIALNLFTDFQAYLKENSAYFKTTYKQVPEFKCAMHFGTVVQSEIGKEVKHLVYHGDVLNTASRLLSQCHTNNTDIIISNQLVFEKPLLQTSYHFEMVNYNNLKGKEQSIGGFAISKKPKNNTKNSNTFFLNQKVTNSHFNNLKFKTL